MLLATALMKQIILMFLLMAIGYAMFKTRIFTLEGNREIGRFLLYVILPCVIINSYLTEFTQEKLVGLLISFAAAAVSLLVSILVSRVLFGSRHKVEHFASAFSNAAFIGIPLVVAAIGEEAVFYVTAFVALLNALQWIYGVPVLSGSRELFSPSLLWKNPIIIGTGIGLFFFISQIPVFPVVRDTLQLVSRMNSPLAMIVLGIYLAQLDLKQLFTGKSAYLSTFSRLVLIPLLTLLVLSLLPGALRDIKLTMLIVASAPVGANIGIFAQLYKQDYSRAVQCVCLSTFLSILTLPVIVGFADYLWS